MAENRGVWGIDIGQAGLKAIRLKYAEAAGQVLAVAFDYVPHPKILSQPDAIPEELIGQALEKFLERNDLSGDMVAISVPGQTALTRFIQLPPVESSKVSEIVKYEARQQIPFALEDVIWRWQVLGGGTEESGFMLEAEVGLFAMKREQVAQHLRPFQQRGVEVDLVQIAPLGLYNFLSYDQLGIRPGDDSAGQDEYTILLDMGADNTTLLVTNGEKIWIRNVPIGGNHFTRALTKEMKLTFAKAEHLKCNATKAPDPRAVFQALRPVFNDYVSEIQRSIGYFSSVNRDAKINKVLGLGNGFKLAGLQKFLQQHLQYEVEKVETFQAAVGDNVLHAPLFEENVLSFAVPYGVALQLLEQSRIKVDLLPDEIKTARKIREKKPWAVLTAAVLLVGLSLSVMGAAHRNSSVKPEPWKGPIEKAEAVASEAGTLSTQYNSQKSEWASQSEREEQLLKPGEDRLDWIMVYRALNECLPRDAADSVSENDISKRKRIKLYSITAKKMPDVGVWFGQLPANPRTRNRIEYMRREDQKIAPSGPGYVFTVHAAHYYDARDEKGNPIERETWVRRTLMANLRKMMHQAPGQDSQVEIPVRLQGITHPVIVDYQPEVPIRFVLDPTKLKRGGLLRGSAGASPFESGYRIPYGGGGYGEGEEMEGSGAGYGGDAGGVPFAPNPYGENPYGGGQSPYGGIMSPYGGGANPYGGGTAIPSLGAVEQEQAKKEFEKNTKMVPLNQFSFQFVWQPVPEEKQRAFRLLARYFEKYPKGSFSGAPAEGEGQQGDPGAQKFVADFTTGSGQRRIDLDQTLYNEYVEKHHHAASDYTPPTEDPFAAAPSAAGGGYGSGYGAGGGDSGGGY